MGCDICEDEGVAKYDDIDFYRRGLGSALLVLELVAGLLIVGLACVCMV